MSRNYLEAFVIVILAAAFIFFLTWPKYIEIRNTEGKIDEKKSEIKNREDYYANLENIAAELDNYQQNLEKINSAFPVNPDVPALMNFVQAAAMQSGLIMKGIDYSGSGSADVGKAGLGQVQENSAGPAAKLSLQKYSIFTSLVGSYDNFKNFLKIIEKSSRLIVENQMSVDAKGQESPKSNQDQLTETASKAGQVLDYSVSLTANYYQ